jgi:TatD DNase family protein
LSLDLIDIGSNLTHESFTSDLDAVMSRAEQAGVRRQVITGADYAGSRQAAVLAEQHPRKLWSTAGTHPHYAQSYAATSRDEWLSLLRQPQVVAVGECGLDYYRDLSPRSVQREAFRAQLAIAAETGKAAFLHQRDAHEDFSALLREFSGSLKAGVAHCFTGGELELEAYLELGLYIGITGWACDERRGLELRKAIPRIPSDRLLIETDAPYLLPRDLNPKPKSRRNEPCYLPHIAAAVAALRGESIDEVARSATRNAETLFGLRDW